MTTVEVFAPAKINLTLHVTGQRDDGYHLLDSLVVFARDVGDKLTIGPSEELSLSVSGPFSSGIPVDDRNLALKAAKLLRSKRSVTRGASISILKNLPHGGGVGGGSADAAAALRALAKLWQVPPLSADDALTLGADLPVCLHAPKPAFMGGIGDIIRTSQNLPECWLVLINPGIVVPTAQVFGRLHKHFSVDNPPMEEMPKLSSYSDFELWLSGTRNDLTMCMYDFQMGVLECIWALRPFEGCSIANMSGSGSTCWGLFERESLARRAADQLRASHEDWWVEVTKVQSS